MTAKNVTAKKKTAANGTYVSSSHTSFSYVTLRPDDARSAPEVIGAIQSHASTVREAARQLTNRIEQFEACLASLEGRVDTWCVGCDLRVMSTAGRRFSTPVSSVLARLSFRA